MVQMFNVGPSKKDVRRQLLGSALGKSLADVGNTYFANKALENVIADPEMDEASPYERASKLEQAMRPFGDKGKQLVEERMGLEQKYAQEQQNKLFNKVRRGEELTEKESKLLPPEIQQKLDEVKKKKKIGEQIKTSLMKAGYPEETAALWQNQIEAAPVGGQTDVIKQVNNLIKRSKTGKGDFGTGEQPKLKTSIQVPGLEDKEYELDFPELPEPIGLTPADVVKQNEHREKNITPIYTETVDRLNALDDEYREIKHLQELNEIPNALPTGLEKGNVDWETGDLRVKALASPETQDYVKTIARMARRAKDFFPGRVTNFDLDQFKQGFPTLANSPEGRKIIAEQLALGNRIAFLKDETYKAAVDHYGAGADPHLIKKYATENYRRLKSQLEQELKEVNSNAQNIIKSTATEVSPGNLRVYDSSGKVVGTVSQEESGQLPEGYSAK